MIKNRVYLGWNFFRLVLEQTASASEALARMIELLETYGQGGNYGYTHQMVYHNELIKISKVLLFLDQLIFESV